MIEDIQSIEEVLSVMVRKLSEILLKIVDKIHSVLYKVLDVVNDPDMTIKTSDSNEEKVMPYVPVIIVFILVYRVFCTFKIPLMNRL